MENGSSRVKFSRGRSGISNHPNSNLKFSGEEVIVENKLTHGFKLASMQLVQIVSGDLH
jgi:hypothetical protein